MCPIPLTCVCLGDWKKTRICAMAGPGYKAKIPSWVVTALSRRWMSGGDAFTHAHQLHLLNFSACPWLVEDGSCNLVRSQQRAGCWCCLARRGASSPGTLMCLEAACGTRRVWETHLDQLGALCLGCGAINVLLVHLGVPKSHWVGIT